MLGPTVKASSILSKNIRVLQKPKFIQAPHNLDNYICFHIVK